MIEDDIEYNNKIEVLKIRRYKAGYEIRREKHLSIDGGDPYFINSAYTVPEGLYIGNSKTAHRLIVQRGIKPELYEENKTICSIGFCQKEQKYYGWSHRAICGFGIGDIVAEGDCTASSGWIDEYLEQHPEKDLSLPIGFEAKTLEDAKRMAIAFAESVS